MTHPSSCSDSQCQLTYREHLLSVNISAAAIPNRRPRVLKSTRIDKKFDKDATAYRTMRKQGIQPPHVDGSHELSQRATEDKHIKVFGEYLFEKHQRSTGVGQ